MPTQNESNFNELLGHDRLMNLARFCPPKVVGRDVTDFTNWLYRL